jgi:hypothetical protein
MEFCVARSKAEHWLGPKAYRLHEGELQGLYVLAGSGGLSEWRPSPRKDEQPDPPEPYD